MPMVRFITDMTFDGQVLKQGALKFMATSGLPGYQFPNHQCVKENDPIPEGYYKVYLANRGTAKQDTSEDCKLAPAWGVEKIPRGTEAGTCEEFWANWGNHRVRLEPADVQTQRVCSPTRGGFYIHDSTKGYSHGCIEVERRFFPHLKSLAHTNQTGFCILRVKYVPGKPTNGGTRA